MTKRVPFRDASRAQSGFVLIAVLAVLVILSILGATVGAITRRLRDQQLERQRQLSAEIAMANTRATVMYLLTSQRMTLGGLTVDDRVVLTEDEQVAQRAGEKQLSLMPVGNELALDGTVYHGLEGARFALQDDGGLLAVNWSPPALLENYLATGGKRGQPIATLISLAQDYQDPDDLYRLNSAERQRYEREGRPPPTNRTLLTPMELRRVIGWDEALAAITDVELNDSMSVFRAPLININTAPARVLRTLPGVDQAMAERVVAVRSISPFLSRRAFYQLLGGVPVDEDLLSLYPSESGTLKLWAATGGTVRILHWTLTPWADGDKPWREDYEFILPGDETTTRSSARLVATKVLTEPDAASQ